MSSQTASNNQSNDPNWDLYRPKLDWLPVPEKTQRLALPSFSQTTPFMHPRKIKVLSYNILAQTLIRRELFPASSKNSLKWPTRRENLLQELKLYDADIMCLQEIDRFEEFYKPAFVDDPKGGYAGAHWTRKLGTKSDGCATFWKKDVFELVALKDLNLNEITLREPFYDGDDSKCDRSELERGNMAQIVALKYVESPGQEHTNPPRGIIIFNTHLFWNPSYNYVRLVQGFAALQEIIKFKEDFAPTWPVVLCGDYNNSSGDPFYEAFFERSNLKSIWSGHQCWLTPDTHYSRFQAHVVKPAKEVLEAENARLPQNEEQKKERQRIVDDMLQKLESKELPELLSCYKEYRLSDTNADYTGQPSIYEPPFTSYGAWWNGPLDYIAIFAAEQKFVENDDCALVPLKFLRVPGVHEIGPGIALEGSYRTPIVAAFPNDVRGSDHLPIMVEFGLCPRKET